MYLKMLLCAFSKTATYKVQLYVLPPSLKSDLLIADGQHFFRCIPILQQQSE